MPNAARHITAQDIDDEGQIVGHFQEWDYPWRQHAFKWRSGAAEQFDHPDFDGIARHRISVTGCNNAGDLVGAYVGENGLQGFLYRNGIFSATSTNRPMDINDRGQIVGIPGDVSAVFDPSGEINTIAFPGALITSAHSIDNFGRVVGYYQLGNGDNKRYGFVATPMLPVRVSVVRRNLPAAAGGALFVTLTRSDTGDPSPLLRVEIDRINGSEVEPVVGEGPVRGFGIPGLDSARVTYRFDARALTPHLLPGRNTLRVVVSLGSGLFLAGEAELSGPTPK